MLHDDKQNGQETEMDIARAQRYKDKMNIVHKRADQIASWTGDLSQSQLLDDDRTRLASYKAFQEIAEACMDIVAMVCKDSGIVPKDDYTNIENLSGIDDDIKAALAEANGLRNRLVHRYNHLDELLAVESMESILPKLIDFTEEVSLWIKKKL